MISGRFFRLSTRTFIAPDAMELKTSIALIPYTSKLQSNFIIILSFEIICQLVKNELTTQPWFKCNLHPIWIKENIKKYFLFFSKLNFKYLINDCMESVSSVNNNWNRQLTTETNRVQFFQCGYSIQRPVARWRRWWSNRINVRIATANNENNHSGLTDLVRLFSWWRQ